MNHTKFRKKQRPNIAVLDSGIGGLTILSTLQQTLKNANFYYIADYQYFPYGILSPEQISQRLKHLFSWIEDNHQIDAYVIACNTASTSSLSELRRLFKKPIVGVVPPIKLAALQSCSKAIAVLATEQTALNSYTLGLIKEFANDCRVVLVGSKELVVEAENKIHGRSIDLGAIAKATQKIRDEPQIDTIALSCTHFPHLIVEFESVGLRPKNWVLPNDGVAKRLQYILLDAGFDPNFIHSPQGGACELFLDQRQDFATLQLAFERISNLPARRQYLP